MKGLNVNRLVAGGFVAGILIWLLEGAASFLYMNELQAVLEARGLGAEISLKAVVLSILVSLIVGFTLVFFYAAVRPRFGPGPQTALIVAVALFLVTYVVLLIGYEMLGIFPGRLLFLWGVIGLVEMVLAALVGGWIYSEA